MAFPNADAKHSAEELIQRGFPNAFISVRCSCTESDVDTLRAEMASRPPVDESKSATPPVDAFTEAMTDFGTAHNKAGIAAVHVMRFLDMRLDLDQLTEYLDGHHFDGTLAGRQKLAEKLLSDFAILPRHIQKMTDEEIKNLNGG